MKRATPSSSIPSTYQPQSVEEQIYRQWETSGLFAPARRSGAQPFSIALPPPNATGVLHLGHSVMLAIQDIVARFQRMRGRRVLWLPGTDHAAIATQAVVEKMLAKVGKTRLQLGRASFLARVRQFVAESQGTIRRQMRKMGSSCDWSRERYTLDAGLSAAVSEAFVRMYRDGLVYRGYRIVNREKSGEGEEAGLQGRVHPVTETSTLGHRIGVNPEHLHAEFDDPLLDLHRDVAPCCFAMWGIDQQGSADSGP